jgi:hypothetical protein
LAKGFQRRRLKCEKLTDDKWWQKLTLPLARGAKNSIYLSNIRNFRIWPLFRNKITKFFNGPSITH